MVNIRQASQIDILRPMFPLMVVLLGCLLATSCARPAETASRTEPELGIEQEPSLNEDVTVLATTEGQATGSESSLNESTHGLGGVLNLDSPSCGIADPAIDVAASRTFGVRLVNEIHAGLTTIEEDPEVRVEYELAESSTLHENGTNYEFALRKNLKFGDGSPLTASDVKWSWERALKKSTGTSRANDVFGWIDGATELVSGVSSELSGVKVVDDRRLTVHLTQPRAEFLMLLSDPVASVLKRENVEGWGEVWSNEVLGLIPYPKSDFSGLPVGAGPFHLVKYALPGLVEVIPGEVGCVLERNDHYWDRPSFLDGVSVTLFPGMWFDEHTPTRQLQQLEAGKIDFGIVNRGTQEFKPHEGENQNTKLVWVDLPPRTRFLAFNPSHAPFDDVFLRRAINKVTEISPLVLPNIVSNENRLVPSSLAHNESTVSGLDFDLMEAIRDLKRSSYEGMLDGWQINHYVLPHTQWSDEALPGIFADWQAFSGLEVKFHEFETVDDDGQVSSIELKPKLEDLHLTEVRHWPNFPGPHQVLRKFVTGFGSTRQSGEFVKIQNMLSDAAVLQDDADRLLRYDMIEQLILDDALALPLLAVESQRQLFVQSWVHGLRFPKFHGSVFHDVRFDGTAPERVLPK